MTQQVSVAIQQGVVRMVSDNLQLHQSCNQETTSDKRYYVNYQGVGVRYPGKRTK